ncbi:hypothetical protein Tco_0642136 [Tanacetum coccineum]
MPCVTSNVATSKVSVFEKYAIDVEPLPPCHRNNRDVHHGYLNRLMDNLDTLHEIVEKAKMPHVLKRITNDNERVRGVLNKPRNAISPRKCDETERKNLFIANDNLIADCLSKDVFYIATNSELTVSRFTKMHDAHTVVQARCLELEAEFSKLHDKVQNDDHTELVKRFSNLDVNHLNLQLKYQNLKESFGNNTSPPARDAPDFDSVFVIEKMKASIQGKDNAIKKIKNANLSIKRDP